mmetsp:Transcript_7386/g.15233  ORF Transcript_7386/g.15233 Transcript_7386/m.15233 type:complete len:496 (+) Transcript_7386:659-2146(+)|eukprot:CAMPEP_0201268328 /NCGR_PEP_ID=MMETSP0853-20130426/28729_1 /ASSEMBLY_ACC=CAM_ASM_000640 /TAXON_ID=183588 /ORGANISM="Pseudo-nitzschia fraudulenta, Strain WWA7" /LENGTH=495 /DNA_ID=CAMNT_0047573957 /DNA_START=214 /DNA_END=1701 /DNA_ORIENTATION=-
MILRNLHLDESARLELNTKLFASDETKPGASSLTLSKVTTASTPCHDSCESKRDAGSDARSASSSSSSCNGGGGLNCDFLLRTSAIHQRNDNRDEGESRIEELTIERCRLDLEGARVLGKALRSDSSAISTLRSLRMVNLSFSEEDSALLPILEGMAEAGNRNGCLESIEFRRITMPSSRALRKRFFSALGECTNLRSLSLTDCDIGSDEDDVRDLAETVRSLSNTLASLDLSRNDIDGTGLSVLLKDGLDAHSSLKRLVLSHNPIGDDGAVHLSRFFSKVSVAKHQKANANAAAAAATTRIESLRLVECDLWSPGCIALSKGLGDFDTLTELIVGGEWEDHLGVVAESMKTNVCLEQLVVVSAHGWLDHLRFEDNDGGSTSSSSNSSSASSAASNAHESTTKTSRERIEYYLALNRAHRKISVIDNERGLSFRFWPTALAKRATTGTRPNQNTGERRGHGCGTPQQPSHGFNDADIWYHLLQRRPELVETSRRP